MLYASPARIREEVASILAGFGHGNGHVFNLGHGIHQDVNPEHAGVFVNAVHELSAQYHGRCRRQHSEQRACGPRFAACGGVAS